MSISRDILIESRDPIGVMIKQLNQSLDLDVPLRARTLHGGGKQASISWQIAEGVLPEGPLVLMDTERFDRAPPWPIDSEFWRRCGWVLSIDERWQLPESHVDRTHRFNDLAIRIMALVGERLGVRCVALSDFQSPLGTFP